MQRSWIVMQVVIVILVSIGIIIAATKLWL